MPLPKTSPTKPYDWTYTTQYPGHLASESNFSFTAADPQIGQHVIPIAELTRQDPILFYAEVPLYEDELHDNGMSQLTIRVVSPLCRSSYSIFPSNLLINSESCLHPFSCCHASRCVSTTSFLELMIPASTILSLPHQHRSSSERRAVGKRRTATSSGSVSSLMPITPVIHAINTFIQQLPSKNDFSPLIDPNFIAKTLSALPGASQQSGAGTGWRGLGSRLEVSKTIL